MPYIITTTLPIRLLLAGSRQTRYAVATLREAQEAAYRIMGEDEEPVSGRLELALGIPESGGTLTLPDETVIEVREVTPVEMFELAGWAWEASTTSSLSQAIAAYNEAQS